MSLKRFAAKRDLTEKSIRLALRLAGALVLTLDAFDLLVLYRGKLFMLDCKSAHGRLTDSQKRLTAMGWPLHYVRTADEALRVIGAIP